MSRKSNKFSYRNFALIILVVILIWMVVPLIFFLNLNSWEERGQFGDLFGGINALFSGLAFSAVAYALHLQRIDLIDQKDELLESRKIALAHLDELKESRETQSQSVALPEIDSFYIEKPRFFFSPPDDLHSAHSRYFAKFVLKNPTDFPTINICARCVITGGGINLQSTDEIINFLPPRAVDGSASCDFMFVEDVDGHFFDKVCSPKYGDVPTMHLNILFKNVSGGCFELQQSFRIMANYPDIEELSVWHSAVKGFHARYRQDLSRILEAHKSKDEATRSKLFNTLAAKLKKSLPGEDKVELSAFAISGHFNLSKITEKEYEKKRSTMWFGTVFGLQHVEADCAQIEES